LIKQVVFMLPVILHLPLTSWLLALASVLVSRHSGLIGFGFGLKIQ